MVLQLLRQTLMPHRHTHNRLFPKAPCTTLPIYLIITVLCSYLCYVTLFCIRCEFVCICLFLFCLFPFIVTMSLAPLRLTPLPPSATEFTGSTLPPRGSLPTSSISYYNNNYVLCILPTLYSPHIIVCIDCKTNANERH